jgi:hypothetical protein
MGASVFGPYSQRSDYRNERVLTKWSSFEQRNTATQKKLDLATEPIGWFQHLFSRVWQNPLLQSCAGMETKKVSRAAPLEMQPFY